MSYQQPCKYSKNQLNLQQVNTYVQIHDLNCGCETPLQHIIFQILQQEPSLKEDKNFKENLEKCLSTGTGGTDPTGDIDDIGDGDLERLFAENFGEEDAGDDR